MGILSERCDNSLVKDCLSRILKDLRLLPGLTKQGAGEPANRCVHHMPGKKLVSGNL